MPEYDRTLSLREDDGNFRVYLLVDWADDAYEILRDLYPKFVAARWAPHGSGEAQFIYDGIESYFAAEMDGDHRGWVAVLHRVPRNPSN